MWRVGLVTAVFYAVFEAALASGAPFGRAAFGGQHEVLPPAWRVLGAFVAAFYVVIAASLVRLGRAAAIAPWERRLAIVLAVFFALGVPLNLASRSAPERFHAVGAALLAVTFFVVARAARNRP